MSLYLFSVWLHIVAAAAWVGSMLFFAIVVVPAMRAPDAAAGAAPLLRALGERYRAYGWGSLAVLLVTGTGNLLLRGIGWTLLSSGEFWSTGFGRALAAKLAVVVLVVCATAGHDVWMRSGATRKVLENRASPEALRYRRWASRVGRSTLILSLVVLYFAVVLVRGAP